MNVSQLQAILSKVTVEGHYLYRYGDDIAPSLVGFHKFRDLVNELNAANVKFPVLESINKILFDLPENDELILTTDMDNRILSLENELITGLMGLKSFLEYNLPIDDENVLRIKIPDADGFDELEKLMNNFKQALTIPLLHPSLNAQTKILRGEPGSLWIVASIVSASAAVTHVLKFIAELCWSAAVIRKKHQEADFVALQVTDYGLGIEYKTVILDAQKKFLNHLVEIEVDGVMHRNNIPADPNYAGQLKNSIKVLDELFKKGAEIHPGLNAPESVANLFPSKSALQIIESRIPQIAKDGVGADEVPTPDAD